MKIRSPFNRPVTEGERQVAFSMSGLVICMVISQACAAATFLIFANSLGTANFGKLSGAIFLQNFFSTMSISGFRSVVIRELIKRPERQSRIIGSYLFLSGLIGCVILLLTTSTVFFLPIENDEKLAYWLIAFGHVGACLIPNAIYDAKKEQVRGAIIATGVDVVTVVIMAVCFAFDLINIPIAAGLIASKWIMVATCSLSDYLLRYPEIWPSLDRNQSRALWSSARIMSIATTLNVLPISLGALLTRILFGASEAGIFAIAAYVLRTHVRIIGLLNRTVYPHVVGACGETSSFVKRMFVAYGGFTLLLSAAALLCSEIALSFFLPIQYSQARPTIVIILLAATIRVAGVVGNMYLVAHYHERTLIAIAIIAFVAFGFTIALPLPVAGRNQIGLAIVASCVCMAGSLLIHVRDLLKN